MVANLPVAISSRQPLLDGFLRLLLLHFADPLAIVFGRYGSQLSICIQAFLMAAGIWLLSIRIPQCRACPMTFFSS